MLVLAIVGLLVITGCTQLAPRIGLASPLVLLALGTGVGFLPMVAPVEADPEIVLQMVLPPLLFGAAAGMPLIDFRRELFPVAALAIGLVVTSAVVLGLVVHALVPAIGLPWAIALGAVLSPTDAVAVSIARDLGVSHRIITILDGEGLFNDATALVLLSSATAAGLMTDADALTPASLAWDFVLALTIAVVIGWAVGEVMHRVCARVTDATASTVVSFTIPFLASIPAEHLGGSGLVAAVVAGLTGSVRAPALIAPAIRRTAQHNWRTLVLVLEGGIFLVMGLEAYGIVHQVRETTGGTGRAVMVAVIAGAVTLTLRAVFVVPMMAWLRLRGHRSRRRYERNEERLAVFEQRLARASAADEELIAACTLTQEEWSRRVRRWNRRLEAGQRRQRRARHDLDYFLADPLSLREASVIIWAGMRGAVTLAAAQTLPLSTPLRPFLLLVALLVAAGSLVLQGLTLPVLIRVVRPQMASAGADERERECLVALLGGADPGLGPGPGAGGVRRAGLPPAQRPGHAPLALHSRARGRPGGSGPAPRARRGHRGPGGTRRRAAGERGRVADPAAGAGADGRGHPGPARGAAPDPRRGAVLVGVAGVRPRTAGR